MAAGSDETVQVLEPQVKKWTREEYHRLGNAGLFDGERVELIEGAILQMSPQGSRHFSALSIAVKYLEHAFGDGCWVRAQGPLILDDFTEPEPDIAVVVGSPSDYVDAHPTSALLVVEVSDSTLAYDRTQKAAVYARAGIADYWIINLIDHQVEVHRQPLPEAASGGARAYADISVAGPETTITPLGAPHAAIRVAEVLPLR